MGRLLRAALLALVVAYLVVSLDGVRAFSVDYTVLWAAGKHAFGPVYDGQFLTAAQAQFNYTGLRPFAYPPTFLLMLIPFGLAPFAISYPAWCGLSAGAFVYAWEPINRQWTPLLLLSPVVALAVLTGQTTIFIGACLAALAARSRPILAGLLFGTALCIKPQAVILLPVGLLVAGRYRVLAATIATSAVWLLASAAVFGPHIWLDWLRALPGFLEYTHALHLTGISPAWLAPGLVGQVAQALGIGLGLAVIVMSFRTGDVLFEIVGVVGGSILVSPYAMRYELAALAPAALAFCLSRTWRVVPGLGLLAAGHLTGPLSTSLFTLLTCRPWERRQPGPASSTPLDAKPHTFSKTL